MAIPAFATAIPLDGIAIPSFGMTIPFDGIAIPDPWYCDPGRWIAVPKGKIAIPNGKKGFRPGKRHSFARLSQYGREFGGQRPDGRERLGGRLYREWLTRQIVLFPSSLKRSAPSFATVIPTGRPQTSPCGVTKPVTKSS